MGIAAAVAGAAVVGAGASIYAGSKAAKATRQAAETSDATNRYIYDTGRADLAPQRELGYGAIGKLASMYGITPQNADGTPVAGYTPSSEPYGGFEASPGYKFRMDEAMKAIERSAAARGSLRSGATMDALQRRAQGVASDEFDKIADRLAGFAGLGTSAVNSTNAAGQAYANQQTNTNMAAGQARASAYANTGNAINQGVGNLASAYLYNKGYGGGFGGGTVYNNVPSFGNA